MNRVVQRDHGEGLGLLPGRKGQGVGPCLEVLSQAGGGHVAVRCGFAVRGCHVDGHLLRRRRIQAHGEVQLTGGLASVCVGYGERQVVVVEIQGPVGEPLVMRVRRSDIYRGVTRAFRYVDGQAAVGLHGAIVHCGKGEFDRGNSLGESHGRRHAPPRRDRGGGPGAGAGPARFHLPRYGKWSG